LEFQLSWLTILTEHGYNIVFSVIFLLSL